MYESKQKRELRSIPLNAGQSERRILKEEREYLLCRTCESKLSIWETYAAGLLFGNGAQVLLKHPRYFQLVGIDYKKMKLFLLSLLWRMSVAKGKFFEGVVLGPEDDEVLRKMLMEGAPGESLTYPCILTGIRFDGVQIPMLFSPTEVTFKNDGQDSGDRAIRVIIHGLAFCFLISSHVSSRTIHEVVLNEVGEMKLMVGDAENMDYVRIAIQMAFQAAESRKNNA